MWCWIAFLQEYGKALKYVRSFLQIEPGNQQVQNLETSIRKTMEKGLCFLKNGYYLILLIHFLLICGMSHCLKVYVDVVRTCFRGSERTGYGGRCRVGYRWVSWPGYCLNQIEVIWHCNRTSSPVWIWLITSNIQHHVFNFKKTTAFILVTPRPYNVGFEVFMAASLKITVFWVVAPRTSTRLHGATI